MKTGILGVLAVLLLTGCSSEQSVTVENQIKLIEYEKCLLLQQDILNTVNTQLAKEESLSSLIEILGRQASSKENARFDIHLKNCEKFRP
jgi:uncharacterized protein YcfL